MEPASQVVCQDDGLAAARNAPNQSRPLFPVLHRETLLIVGQGLIDFGSLIEQLTQRAFCDPAGFSFFRLLVKHGRIAKRPPHAIELIRRAPWHTGVGKLLLTNCNQARGESRCLEIIGKEKLGRAVCVFAPSCHPFRARDPWHRDPILERQQEIAGDVAFDRILDIEHRRPYLGNWTAGADSVIIPNANDATRFQFLDLVERHALDFQDMNSGQGVNEHRIGWASGLSSKARLAKDRGIRPASLDQDRKHATVGVISGIFPAKDTAPSRANDVFQNVAGNRNCDFLP